MVDMPQWESRFFFWHNGRKKCSVFTFGMSGFGKKKEKGNKFYYLFYHIIIAHIFFFYRQTHQSKFSAISLQINI